MEKTMRKSILALAFACLTGPAMARGNIEILARTCNNCHGVGGVSAGASMPSIGGLPKGYLRNIMKQWKYDERTGVTMSRIVKGFSDDEIDALAAYFAAQPWVPVAQIASPELLHKGKSAISETCEDCHGMTGNDPDVGAPRLNGQWSKYMELELEKYRSNEFTMPHRKMKKAVHETRPADSAAAARYFGAQGR
jgi:cytochrome subunit of sulfide dehydrogenase